MNSKRFPVVLLAPNSLKNSITALKAVDAMKEGIQEAWPEATVLEKPIADGGELTMDILLKARGGERKEVDVFDPLGREIKAEYGFLADGETAVVELAKASGFSLLKEREKDPLRTTTYGTGQLIHAALDEGAKRIIIGLGGSATVDGGAGMLQALGYQLLTNKGTAIEWGGKGLQDLAAIDGTHAHPRLLACEFLVACDVSNPLLGEKGAAPVFAPQKGAGPDEVRILDNALQHFAHIVTNHLRTDIGDFQHGGAAGGIAASLGGLLKAQLLPGADFLLDEIQIQPSIDAADLVITAEGALDDQTLQGKAPYGVSVRASQAGKPVILLAGQVPKELSPAMKNRFDAIFPISHQPSSLCDAIADTYTNLVRTSFAVTRVLHLSNTII